MPLDKETKPSSEWALMMSTNNVETAVQYFAWIFLLAGFFSHGNIYMCVYILENIILLTDWPTFYKQIMK